MLEKLLQVYKKDFKSDLDKQLEKTRRELIRTRKYFNSVSEPDLIDHAIYLLKATERKYSYLLKKKKNNN